MRRAIGENEKNLRRFIPQLYHAYTKLFKHDPSAQD